ncbi:MAG: hypothetical protein R3F34_01660 [Planctomycetota bacterium]
MAWNSAGGPGRLATRPPWRVASAKPGAVPREFARISAPSGSSA